MTSPSQAAAAVNAAFHASSSTRADANATSTAVVYIVPSPPSKPHPLNVLGASTRIHVLRQLRSAMNDPSVKSIVLIGGGKGRAFSAGADITEFDSEGASVALGGGAGSLDGETIPTLTEVANYVEASPKPIVAAINGVALGGGFELALSSHYRVADRRTAIFGLPEVNIGLIPGAGGTQRLPRLSWLKFALDVITSGRILTAEEAKTAGIVDGFREEGESLSDCARRWASWSELLPLDHRRTSLRSVPGGTVEELSKLCDDVAKRLPKKEQGGEAARACVDAVRASFDSSSFDAGLNVERDLFLDLLLNSDQGRGRRHAFFAVRSAGVGDEGPPTDAKGVEMLRRLTRGGKGAASVGVVGAGTMGSGIAVSFLRAGYDPVILVDNNAEGLERGVKSIQKILAGDVAKGKLDESKARAVIAALRPSTDMTSLRDCLIIVEAVYENLNVKRSIFRTLNDIVTNPDALLLSNTSTLDVDAISSALPSDRRRNCAGMHFFSPAHVMKLVEIVKSSSTSPSTLSAIRAVTKRLGKIGVTVGNCHGFVGNRMFGPYTSEMVFTLEEGGGSVLEIDEALTEFGMAIGPFVVADLAGNDIGYLIRKEQGLTSDPITGAPGRNRKPGQRYTDLGDELVTKLGRVGQKALKGWYDYDPKIGKGRRPISSEEVSKFVAACRRAASPSSSPPPTRKMTNGEIVERLLYPLVNESFKILEEGVASKPSDVDVIYLHGYGWPAWRGGPVFWADHEVGLTKLLSKLEEFHVRYPGSDYFRPSELLRECVSIGITVEEYYKRGLHRRRRSSASAAAGKSISKL